MGDSVMIKPIKIKEMLKSCLKKRGVEIYSGRKTVVGRQTLDSDRLEVFLSFWTPLASVSLLYKVEIIVQRLLIRSE